MFARMDGNEFSMHWRVVEFISFFLPLMSSAFIYGGSVISPYLKQEGKQMAQLLSSDNNMRSYYIRDARKSDLTQVADLMMLCFSPEVNDPIRKMFEICRLQTNFPCPDDQHMFLVACATENAGDGINADERILGFCKVDGREQTDMFRTLSESFPQFKDQLPPGPYATDLAVHPNNRRKGIGSELMREVELRVQGWNVDSFFLGVEADNLSALAMYYGLGYEVFIETMIGEKYNCVQLLQRRLNNKIS